MNKIDFNNIDLSRLNNELRKFEKQWVAISNDNKIVANGVTYRETNQQARQKGMKAVVLLRVPPLDYSLAP